VGKKELGLESRPCRKESLHNTQTPLLLWRRGKRRRERIHSENDLEKGNLYSFRERTKGKRRWYGLSPKPGGKWNFLNQIQPRKGEGRSEGRKRNLTTNWWLTGGVGQEGVLAPPGPGGGTSREKSKKKGRSEKGTTKTKVPTDPRRTEGEKKRRHRVGYIR